MDPITVVSHRDVPPDPSIADAVGTRHELPTALADLLDNAIDAGAGRVHIRFLTSGGTLTGLLVTDDGKGMDEAVIDAAMTFARRRDYGERDLGHYGLGLKAASLSQADVLDVLSRAVGGVPVGRRIARDRPTRVETLDPRQVGESLAAPLFRIPGAAPSHGTVVRWHGLRTVLTAPDPGERARWLSECIEEVRTYLGLVFHRILERSDIEVSVDEFDLGIREAGAMRGVRALDPLARGVTGVRPTLLDGAVNGQPFTLTAVVLTEDALRDPAVRASARVSTAPNGQGLYVYRRDRLLQVGGWCSVIREGRDHDRLRISLDVNDTLLDVVQVNPEKSGVVLDADMRRAVHDAVSGSGRGPGVLGRARSASAQARRRTRRPVTLVEPGRGLSRQVYDAVADTVEFAEADPVDIRWRRLPGTSLVSVDIEQRTLWLNDVYRPVLSGSSHPEDAPLLKTLLLLLYSPLLKSAHLGDRRRREMAAWDSVISAALDEELRNRAAQRGRTHD
jgi:hypothetical protein avisC_05692